MSREVSMLKEYVQLSLVLGAIAAVGLPISAAAWVARAMIEY
ncbi:MAG: hypothetical protein ABI407_18455 [Bradyrhizobium sp.]